MWRKIDLHGGFSVSKSLFKRNAETQGQKLGLTGKKNHFNNMKQSLQSEMHKLLVCGSVHKIIAIFRNMRTLLKSTVTTKYVFRCRQS